VLLALGIGGFMAAALLVILAAYLPLRRGLAVWAGQLRMRRVLRQDLRRRRPPTDRGRR
jgi:predicted alpha/beta-hydrolase family hydrolase